MPTINDFKDRDGVFVGTFMCLGKQYTTKSYMLWYDVRKRCTKGGSVQKREPTYTDCTMSGNFSNYQYFAEWCTRQVGYNLGYHLDKDILFKNNKVYSEESCVFVPKQLNNFLTSRNKCRGQFPQGVSFHKNSGLYASSISISSVSTHIGLYRTPLDAHKAYITAKECEARRWAKRLSNKEFTVDERVIDALLKWRFEMDENYFNIASKRIAEAQENKLKDS